MTRSALSVVLSSLLVLMVGGEVSPSETADFAVEDYAELVHRYLQGDSARSRLALLRVPAEAALEAAREYMTRWVVEPQIKAAVLLHTDTAMSTSGPEVTLHIQAARQWMRKIDPSPRRSFERRWHLVMAYHYQSELRLREVRPVLWEARSVMESAFELFPDDIDLPMAFGVLHETAGVMLGDLELVDEARKQFRAIVKIEPHHTEAHVRLGHVLALLGRGDEAMEELRWGLEAVDAPPLRLVALLTLGDLCKTKGELTEAIRFYREAVETDPDCQSAAIALAHTLHETGDADGSYEVMAQFLSGREIRRYHGDAGEANLPDLWWRYLFGDSSRFGTLLRELRSETQ